jgi:hypothetical protein
LPQLDLFAALLSQTVAKPSIENACGLTILCQLSGANENTAIGQEQFFAALR